MVAVQVEPYIKKIRTWVNSFFKEKPTLFLSPTQCCCIRLDSREMTLLQLNKSSMGLGVSTLHSMVYESIDSLAVPLAELSKKYKLNLMPTYWLLSPENYQIFLIESLPVKPEEMLSALSWRIRGLITYPIEEAVIDYFPLPNKKSGATNSMQAVVTARKDDLNKIMGIFKSNGLSLTTIDIPEIALRNLTALSEKDEKSTAFIFFYESLAIFNITQKEQLFFTRHIDLPTAELQTKDYEQLALEILRYFDYFQSQWRLSPPSKLFVAAEKRDAEIISKTLSQYLSFPVELFKLSTSLAITEASTIDKKYLLNFGCALGESYATAEN